MTRRIVAITLMAALAATGCAAQSTVVDLTADYTDAVGATFTLADAGTMRLEFEIVDGRTGEMLDGPPGHLGDGLSVSQQPSLDGAMLRWPVIFANDGGAQRWLEVRAVVRPEGDGAFGFWNGHADYSPAPAVVPPMPASMCTPLVTLSGENAGLAWGLEADALMSWYEGAAENGSFRFGCRIVVDPGETYRLPLIFFSHPGTFGYLDAFERYHDLFPGSFAIERPNVDPRAAGAGCDYVGWHQGSPELVRRVGGSWDWCMKSWRLPGNWANRPELWRDDFGNLERWNENWAAKAEHMERCDFAGMYYIWPGWTDEDLAAERWPEALVHDPLASRVQWENVTMAHLTFPANEAYLAWTKEHLQEVLAGGKYHGFGLDSAGSDGRARGPAAQASPGRAWDEDGVYCRVNAGMAQLMDVIHEMDAQHGHKAAAAPNGGDWMILSRADAILIEHSPLRWKNEWVNRLNAGEKVLNWWDQFDVWRLTDWEDASAEQLRHDVAAMARFMRLRSLQLGGVPMYRQASGIVSTMEDLPEIVEIVQAGWQPVPAMKGDDRLWLSRYGPSQGTPDCYLVVCNPEAEPVVGEIEVFGEYLTPLGFDDENGFLFAEASGEALEQRVDGRRTTLDVLTPPAWQRVFSPVASTSAGAQFEATVGFFGDVDRRVLRIQVLDVAAPFELVPNPDWQGEEWLFMNDAVWNGEPLQALRDPHLWPFQISEPGTLEIELTSRWFDAPAEEILDFRFIEHGAPACSIVIPEDATSDETYAAFRIQEYFRFSYSQPDRDGKPTVEGPVIPIVSGEVDGPRVLLRRHSPGPDEFPVQQYADVRVEGDALVLEYVVRPKAVEVNRVLGLKPPSFATDTVYQLLHLLDRVYPFYGATSEKFEHERERMVYERAGLINDVLNDREELGM